ncbi:Ribosomal protein L9/RNase H1, N-terminal [Penicillium italicum]|uniref:ribonuclease H n=1 Tax=Penicillium italicum TaxID=40296 RepID=A0A0A2L3B4_PENIT|nr:Ribosomal protein L9/RNase H1, N-terminal [Penicillium italicum]
MAATILQWFPHTTAPFIANAPMFGFADAGLATAVTKAGGFGFIGGGFDFGSESTQLLGLDTQLTNARSIIGLINGQPLPLGVGFITFQPDGLIGNAIPILQKHRVAAVWLSFPRADADHIPIIQSIRRAQETSGWDVKIFVQVGTIKAAEEAFQQGVDVLVVQGTDAGGHQWAQGASLISLLPEVRDLLSKAQNTTTAILAAGGIVDGRGCVAALGLGADGIVMGTRFVATSECAAPSVIKQTIVSGSDGGVLTIKSIRHDVFQSTDVFPRQYDGRAIVGVSYEDSRDGVSDEEIIRRYNEAREAGEHQRRTVWAGASIGSIHAVVSVEHVIQSTQQGRLLPNFTTLTIIDSTLSDDKSAAMNKTTPSPSPVPKASPGSKPSPSPTAGTKRKRNTAAKYYAVKAGHKPGIYYGWNDCLAQITGFKGAIFQSFPSQEAANAFLSGIKLPAESQTSENTRFYGIQRGRVTGVYTDWTTAQEQIRGFPRPRYRKFSTREEAEEFVREGQTQPPVGFGEASGPSGPHGITIETPKDAAGVEFAPGDGPLPEGAEDGFDPNVLLDPATGKVVYKTAPQMAATKTQSTGIPGMLRIYTDGSSLRNGTPLASAGVGVYFGPGDSSRNVSEPLKGSRQTNQRAELTAILRAIDIAPRHRDVTIITDSRYSIDCVTVWFINWRRNNWMTRDKKPVENKDLVESILIKIEERNDLKVKTLFEWVKGHNKDPGNEEADKLAVNGAQRGVSAKAEALHVAQEVPDELFDEDF